MTVPTILTIDAQLSTDTHVVISILLVLIFLIMGALVSTPAHAIGTLDSELERNKEALKEFKTLSDYEKCLYLQLTTCDALK